MTNECKNPERDICIGCFAHYTEGRLSNDGNDFFYHKCSANSDTDTCAKVALKNHIAAERRRIAG